MSRSPLCGRVVSLEKRDDKSFEMKFSEGGPMTVRSDTAQDAQRWVAKIEARTGYGKTEEMPSQEEVDQDTRCGPPPPDRPGARTFARTREDRSRPPAVTGPVGRVCACAAQQLRYMLEAMREKPEVQAKVLGMGLTEKWMSYRQKEAKERAEREMGDTHNDVETWIIGMQVEPTALKLQELYAVLRTQPIAWVEVFVMQRGVKALCGVLEEKQLKALRSEMDYHR